MKKEVYLSDHTLSRWATELSCYQRHPHTSFNPAPSVYPPVIPAPDRCRGQAPAGIHTDCAIGSALLVLDLQNYFLSPQSHAFVPQAPHILPKLRILAQYMYTQDRPVIFTQHADTDPSGNMSRWWGNMLNAQSPEHALYTQFDLPAAPVLHKRHYSAFQDTDLKSRLSNLNIRHVIIAGVMTHLCCESTARAAFMQGFDVTFLTDGTATYTEALHLGTLRALSHGFAQLSTCDELMRQFQEPAG